MSVLYPAFVDSAQAEAKTSLIAGEEVLLTNLFWLTIRLLVTSGFDAEDELVPCRSADTGGRP